MKIPILLAGLWLCASSAMAQEVHECDKPQPVVFEVPLDAPVRIGFCHSGRDAAGAAVTDFQIVVGNAAPLSVGIPVIVGAPSPSGLNYYESAEFLATAGGSFSIVAVAPGGTSLPSTVITLVIASLPDPPTGVRIVR